MRFTQSLVWLAMLCGATVVEGQTPATAAATSRPQAVRVSYVQGEVKVSTGTAGQPDLSTKWVAAGVNFPIVKGATLATENGRAEVEFENGSMAYLAEHSVLQFLKLKSDPQGTTSLIRLLTGRATFELESNGHDVFEIGSSAAMFRMKEKTALRVESALDGALFRVVEGTIAILLTPA